VRGLLKRADEKPILERSRGPRVSGVVVAEDIDITFAFQSLLLRSVLLQGNREGCCCRVVVAERPLQGSRCEAVVAERTLQGSRKGCPYI